MYVALPLAMLLAMIGVLHFYWADGGKWGSAGVIPTNPEKHGTRTFDPGPVPTISVGLMLLAAAAIVFAAVGWIDLPGPDWIVRVGIWALAIVMLLRGVGEFRYVGLTKRIKGTEFARLDGRYFTPLVLVISALSFWIAIKTG